MSIELSREFGAFESNLSVLLDADAAIVLGADLIDDYQVAGFMLKRKLSDQFNLVMVTNRENKLADNFANRLVTVGNNFEQIVKLLACYKDGGVCDETDKIIENEGLKAHRAYRLLETVQTWQHPVIIIGKEFAKLENLETLRNLVSYSHEVGAKVIILKGDTNSFAASLLGLELNPEIESSPVAFYALGDGHACHHALDGMKNSGFKIVQTSYMNELAELADIILPCKIWAEEEGHYLTTDGRIELNRQAITAGELQRSVSEVLIDLSVKSGFSLQPDWQAIVTDRISSIVLA